MKKLKCLGAIVGDVVGSTYEFIGNKKYDFELFPKDSSFTDDTVMTIAAMDALTGDKNFGKSYMKWGHKYPHESYGVGFNEWLKNGDPTVTRDSFGNGSAMRCSPIGWFTDDINGALEWAEKSAAPTHIHREGIKGAQMVATAVFMAREGRSKAEIRKFLEQKFDIYLGATIAEIHDDYEYSEACQFSVPESIIAFLDSNGFEDALRKVISLGGDADTMAAITGAIAEAFYGIPDEIYAKILTYLPDDFIKTIRKFNRKIK